MTSLSRVQVLVETAKSRGYDVPFSFGEILQTDSLGRGGEYFSEFIEDGLLVWGINLE